MNMRLGLMAALVVAVLAFFLQLASHPQVSSNASEQPRLAVETPSAVSPWTTQWGGFNYLTRIHVVSDDSVWGAGSHAVHFDGHSWRAVDRRDFPAGLNGVDVLPDGTGWIVGDEEEVIPVRDGKACPSIHVPGYRFRDVAVVTEDDAWALARSSLGSNRAVILRYEDGVWNRAWTAPDNEVRLNSIWMASPDEGWAVGNTAVHYDGETWTEWALPLDVDMKEVRGSARDDVWVAGGKYWPPVFPESHDRRVIQHFDGEGWSVVLDESLPGFEGLAVRGHDGYAVSATGDVLALRSGAWVELSVSVPAGWEPPHLVSGVSFVPGAPPRSRSYRPRLDLPAGG